MPAGALAGWPMLAKALAGWPMLAKALASCDAREVDEPALDVGADELHPHAVADVETLGALLELALDRRLEQPHPGALLGSAGDDAVELLPDALFEEQRRRRLAHLALDLGGVVFLVGAVPGQLAELGERVGRRRAGERRLDQALRDDVRIAAVGRRRVGVVAHREAEVPGGLLARQVDGVFARAHELDHGGWKVGEAQRVGLAPAAPEGLELPG